MKHISNFQGFLNEHIQEGDETLRTYSDWQLGETRQISNVYRDLPESAATPKPGNYTLEIIPIQSTDLYNDFVRTGHGSNSGQGTIPALSREYWAHDDYDGYQTDQLDMIKGGWDSPQRLPIIVEEEGGVYKVIDGHHRLTIAKELGKRTILALVRKESTDVVFETKGKFITTDEVAKISDTIKPLIEKSPKGRSAVDWIYDNKDQEDIETKFKSEYDLPIHFLTQVLKGVKDLNKTKYKTLREMLRSRKK